MIHPVNAYWTQSPSTRKEGYICVKHFIVPHIIGNIKGNTLLYWNPY